MGPIFNKNSVKKDVCRFRKQYMKSTEKAKQLLKRQFSKKQKKKKLKNTNTK